MTASGREGGRDGAARTALGEAVQHLEDGEWEAAHGLVQALPGPLASWAHGIVHLLEGDLDNARYWYRRAGRPCPYTDPDTDPDTGPDAGAGAVHAEIAALRAAVHADTTSGRTS